MVTSFKSLSQCIKYFADEETAYRWFESVRFADGVVCPHCDSDAHSRVNTRILSLKATTYKDFRCKACDKKYSILTGTVMQATSLPLQTWMCAIWLFTNTSKGVSSANLALQLGITQKTAWFVLSRLRTMFGDDGEILGIGGQIVEVDETYVGGKMKNMTHKKRKEVGNKGANNNKHMIVGYLERGGNIKMQASANRHNVLDAVIRNVSEEAVLFTDQNGIYHFAGNHFAAHETVDHANKEYVREKVIHTNSIEGAFGHFDRMVMGVYHYVSPKHMQLYCNEYVHRYNNRKLSVGEKFHLTARALSNSRVTYRELVGR